MARKEAKKDTDFADRLEGGKSFTVFAPTDKAFKNFEKELNQLKPDELHRTILFHFYENVVMTYDDLECSSKLTSLTIVDTSRTKCQRIADGVFDKNQRGRGNKDIGVYPLIDTKSKEACTSIVHSVNNVLLPIVFKPFKSMIIVDDENFDEDSEEAIIINKEEDEKEEKEEEVVEEEKEEEKEVVEEEGVEEDKPFEEEVVGEDKPVEEEVVEEEKTVDEESNGVLVIDGSTSVIDWGDAEKPEGTPTLDGVDFDRDDKAPVGSDEYVTGTQIETPEVDPADSSGVAAVKEAVGGEEDEIKEPRIGALGINLIIFSTLLLCFVFVCMRR